MVELKYIRALIGLLTESERRQTPLLVGLLVVSGFLEIIGLGTVFAFTGILNELSSSSHINFRYRLIDPDLSNWSVERFAVIGGLALAAIFVFKTIILLGTQRKVMGFIFSIYERFSVKLLSGYMEAPLSFYVDHSSADVQRNLNVQSAIVFNTAAASLAYIASNVIGIGGLFAVLCLIDPLASFWAVGLLAIVGSIYYWFIRRRLSELGHQRHTHIAAAIKWVNHSISGIREIRIAGTEPFFKKGFHQQVHAIAVADRNLRIVSLVPSLVNEGALVIGVVGMTLLYLFSGHTLPELLPILATFGLAGLRVLGMSGSMVTHVQNLQFHGPAIVALRDLIKKFDEDSSYNESFDLTFEKSVMLDKVCFSYSGSDHPLLSDVSIDIPKGSHTALLGVSGCGKTTLLSILLGLIEPSSGLVLVDGIAIRTGLRAWFDKVAYVPQSIFILDDTVRANILLGRDSGEERIWSVLEAAQLGELIRSLPDGLDSRLGENGARLSGGERQRIGIARALYGEPELLVLDEATSGLDRMTETAVMEGITRINPAITLIAATHRIETSQNYDVQYLLINGKIFSGSDLYLPVEGSTAL